MIELGIQLDTLLEEPKSRAAWRAIVALFDRCPDSELPALFARAEPRLAAWPDRLRTLPKRWWKRLVAGKSEPRAAIARVRKLWSQDEDDDDFSVFTYAVQVDVSPKLTTFALADAAEWHHNGGDIGLLDTTQGRLRAMLLSGSDYHGEPYALTYSPDGQWIAAAPVESMYEGDVRVWDAETGELRWEQPFGNPKPRSESGDGDDGEPASESIWLDWSADSRLVAAASARFGSVSWWSARTGEELGQLPEEPGATALRFSPDGATLAVARGGRIRIWSLAERRVIAASKASKHEVWGLCFSADGATLAAVSRRAITLYAVKDGALVRTSRERVRLSAQGGFEAVSMTPLEGGKIRIATVVTGGVELRDWPEGGARKIAIPKSELESIRLARDGRHLITASTGKAQLFWL